MTEMELWLQERMKELEDYFPQEIRLPGLQWFMKHRVTGMDVDLRTEAIERFCFSILTQAVVDRLLPHGPFLEVGAGTGYWAHELRRTGADIIATDPNPYCFPLRLFPEKIYGEVARVDAVTAIRTWPGRTLLMAWPSLGEQWPLQALEEFTRQGGEKLVHVGEWRECCATDEFYDVLESSWNMDHWVGAIPQWSGIHDEITVCTRKNA